MYPNESEYEDSDCQVAGACGPEGSMYPDEAEYDHCDCHIPGARSHVGSMYPHEAAYDWDVQTAVLQLLASRCVYMSALAAYGLLQKSAAGRQFRIDEIVPRALGDLRVNWSPEERRRLVAAMWIRDQDGNAHPPSSEGD